eukprot:PhF_6_TR38700/c0_g1_i6/m.57910
MNASKSMLLSFLLVWCGFVDMIICATNITTIQTMAPVITTVETESSLLWDTCGLESAPCINPAATTPCTRMHATCSYDGSIEHIALRNCSLVCHSRATVRLSKVQWFDMSFNHLGSLPQFVNPKILERLSCARCRLTGTLPEFGNERTKLWQLDLSDNSFSGTLPESWGTSLRAMKNLALKEIGEISGTLPASWGSFKELKLCFLDLITIRGPIPASWGSWEHSLQNLTIHLYFNRSNVTDLFPLWMYRVPEAHIKHCVVFLSADVTYMYSVCNLTTALAEFCCKRYNIHVWDTYVRNANKYRRHTKSPRMEFMKLAANWSLLGVILVILYCVVVRVKECAPLMSQKVIGVLLIIFIIGMLFSSTLGPT